MSTTARFSAGFAGQVLLDEFLIAALKDPALIPHGDDYEHAADDLRAAINRYEREGWIEDPASYHCDPPPPERQTVERRRVLELRYEHVRFNSGFNLAPGEPGGDRWRRHEANDTVHAWMLRHRQGPRPWLVVLHGFGMGRPYTDLQAFRAPQLYRHGLNVVAPVLPLHGPRTTSRIRGEGFMSINLLDSVHGLAQSAWDVRRTVRWLREEHGAQQIGLYGISLGAYVAALVASLEEGLACVIAGMPFADLPGLYRRHSPRWVRDRAEQAGALGGTADAVHRVVSPLAMSPVVPVERRFIFAGLGDRMSTFAQAQRLWLHWDRPELAAYDGGHVGFYWSGQVNRFIDDALTRARLLPSPVPAMPR